MEVSISPLRKMILYLLNVTHLLKNWNVFTSLQCIGSGQGCTHARAAKQNAAKIPPTCCAQWVNRRLNMTHLSGHITGAVVKVFSQHNASSPSEEHPQPMAPQSVQWFLLPSNKAGHGDCSLGIFQLGFLKGPNGLQV